MRDGGSQLASGEQMKPAISFSGYPHTLRHPHTHTHTHVTQSKMYLLATNVPRESMKNAPALSRASPLLFLAALTTFQLMLRQLCCHFYLSKISRRRRATSLERALTGSWEPGAESEPQLQPQVPTAKIAHSCMLLPSNGHRYGFIQPQRERGEKRERERGWYCRQLL